MAEDEEGVLRSIGLMIHSTRFLEITSGRGEKNGSERMERMKI